MRKFTLALLAVAATLATGAANAADLPRKAPPMVMPAPVFSWTGFYIGINGGYGWADTKNGFTEFDNASGGVFGVQGGFNYQFAGSPIVIGIEADYQGANIKADGIFFGTLTNVELERFGTVRGRLGFAWDRFLIYGTGGWAYGAQTEISLGFPFFVSGRQELSGWTAGAGIEWAFAPNWSAKIEYLHLDLKREGFFGPEVCLLAGLHVRFECRHHPRRRELPLRPVAHGGLIAPARDTNELKSLRKEAFLFSRLGQGFVTTTTRGPRTVHCTDGALLSRCWPPTPASNHAAAAPSSAAAPAMNARITVLRRARAMLSFALAMAVSTRRSASGWPSPVRAATRRVRYARSSAFTPVWLDAVSRMRAASARVA